MSLWLNSDGNLIVGDSGAPIICDNCPCVAGVCGTCATSYTITHNGNFLLTTPAVVTFTTTPFCSSYPTIAAAACVWEGIGQSDPLACLADCIVYLTKPLVGVGTGSIIIFRSGNCSFACSGPVGKDVSTLCPSDSGGKYSIGPTNFFTVT